MKKDINYLNFEKFVVIICLLSAVFLSIAALFIPPAGIVSSSVLILIAEWLTFVGALMGIKLTALKHIQKMIETSEKK